MFHGVKNSNIVSKKSVNTPYVDLYFDKNPVRTMTSKNSKLPLCTEERRPWWSPPFWLWTKAAVCHGISIWLPNWSKSHLTLQTPLTVSDHLNQSQEGHQEESFSLSCTRWSRELDSTLLVGLFSLLERHHSTHKRRNTNENIRFFCVAVLLNS